MRRYFRRPDSLRAPPYAQILAYPGAGPGAALGRAARARIAEMKRLGITGVSFEGQSEVCGVRVLGKGHTGMVVLAARGRGRRAVALKIRRADSPRAGMAREARLLAAANAAGAGPRLVGHTRNMLAMEHLDGPTIERWIAGDVRAARAKAVAREVLEGCYRMDVRGLDHGELSNIARHVVVVEGKGGGSDARIVDFESSSTSRRASNVTAAAQGMFIGSGVAKGMARAYRLPRRDDIIRALREYKRNRGRDSFEGLLGVLGLS